jgi:hypothetical protein
VQDLDAWKEALGHGHKLRNVIGVAIETFTPQQCRNCFAITGYDAD